VLSLLRLKDVRPYLYYVGFYSAPSSQVQPEVEKLPPAEVEDAYVKAGRRYLLQQQQAKVGFVENDTDVDRELMQAVTFLQRGTGRYTILIDFTDGPFKRFATGPTKRAMWGLNTRMTTSSMRKIVWDVSSK